MNRVKDKTSQRHKVYVNVSSYHLNYNKIKRGMFSRIITNRTHKQVVSHKIHSKETTSKTWENHLVVMRCVP